MRTVRPRSRRRLSLIARLAATSFAAARKGEEGRRAPRRIRLRWRRPSARTEGHRSRTAPPPAPHAWHPHVHVHFGVVANAGSRAAAAARGDAVAGRERELATRELREHLRSSTLRTERVWARTRVVAGPLRVTARRLREQPAQAGRAAWSAPAAHALMQGASRLSWRRSVGALGTRRSQVSRAGGTTGTVAAPRWNTRSLPMLLREQRNVGTRPASSTVRNDAPTPAWRTRRPVPLVWRGAGADSGRSPAAPSRALEASSVPPPVSHRTSAASAAPAASESPRTRASFRTSDFEPGVLDRLADDVIRRVERRARIERERRGL
jgi:hypothetical protein